MEYTSRWALALRLGISCSNKGLHLKYFIDNPFHLETDCTPLKQIISKLRSNLKIWLSEVFYCHPYSEYMNGWVNDSTRTLPDYITFYSRNNKKFQKYLRIRHWICSDYPSRSIALGVIHLHWYFPKLFQWLLLPLLQPKPFSSHSSNILVAGSF